MTNNFMLVGRLIEKPNIKDNQEELVLYLQINKFKSDDYDIIPLKVSGNIATSICEYCDKGSLIGSRGRIEIKDNVIILKADKITFLSSNSNN